MRILREGKLPEERLHIMTCGRCNCQFEIKQSEGLIRSDQREGSYLYYDCPTCKKPVTKSVGDKHEKEAQ